MCVLYIIMLKETMYTNVKSGILFQTNQTCAFVPFKLRKCFSSLKDVNMYFSTVSLLAKAQVLRSHVSNIISLQDSGFFEYYLDISLI